MLTKNKKPRETIRTRMMQKMQAFVERWLTYHLHYPQLITITIFGVLLCLCMCVRERHWKESTERYQIHSNSLGLVLFNLGRNKWPGSVIVLVFIWVLHLWNMFKRTSCSGNTPLLQKLHAVTILKCPLVWT